MVTSHGLIRHMWRTIDLAYGNTYCCTPRDRHLGMVSDYRGEHWWY